NQFSTNPSLRTYNPSPAPNGDAGGLGRKGAQKMIIFETDGQPQATALASLVNDSQGAYYKVRWNSSDPSSSDKASVTILDSFSNCSTQAQAILNQICALETATPPGFSTASRPVLVHCIAFGPIFEDGSTSPQKTPGLTLMQQMEVIGKVQPATTNPPQLAP